MNHTVFGQLNGEPTYKKGFLALEVGSKHIADERVNFSGTGTMETTCWGYASHHMQKHIISRGDLHGWMQHWKTQEEKRSHLGPSSLWAGTCLQTNSTESVLNPSVPGWPPRNVKGIRGSTLLPAADKSQSTLRTVTTKQDGWTSWVLKVLPIPVFYFNWCLINYKIRLSGHTGIHPLHNRRKAVIHLASIYERLLHRRLLRSATGDAVTTEVLLWFYHFVLTTHWCHWNKLLKLQGFLLFIFPCVLCTSASL